MASRPYTERFVETTTQNSFSTFYVPAGMRAVVRCITVTNYSGQAINALVLVHGYSVWDVVLQVAERCRIADLRCVAYEGEAIAGYSDGANFHLTVTGYLFSDAYGPAEADRALGPGVPVSPED